MSHQNPDSPSPLEYDDPWPAEMGFRSGSASAHTSRTMMLAELTALLDYCSGSSSKENYLAAIVDENVLAKKTSSTREKSARHLRELYSLDEGVPLFRALLYFWRHDESGRPLLGLLCCSARDVLLRASTEAILALPIGEEAEKSAVERLVGQSESHELNGSVLNKVARNVLSSWTQSGHLKGSRTKVRTQPVATPANTAYAFLLAYLQGLRGQFILNSFWAKLLDRPQPEIIGLAKEASRRGWMDFRMSGIVVDVGFSNLPELAKG